MFNKNDSLKILLFFLFKAGFPRFKGPQSRLLCCTAISWITGAIARMKASGSRENSFSLKIASKPTSEFLKFTLVYLACCGVGGGQKDNFGSSFSPTCGLQA